MSEELEEFARVTVKYLKFSNDWKPDAKTTMSNKAVVKVIKLIEEQQAKIKELEKLTQWQPIETAPKDGTRILILDKENGINILFFNKHQNAWFNEFTADFKFKIEKLGWQPLPKPPLTDKDEIEPEPIKTITP